jgi:hypothetical protein
MKNIASGPNACIDMCRSVVIYADISQDLVDAMPVCLHEEEPLAFPEPGSSCTAQLSNGDVVGLFYGTCTRRLAFFPGIEITTGDRMTVQAIINESNLPKDNVYVIWDQHLDAKITKEP